MQSDIMKTFELKSATTVTATPRRIPHISIAIPLLILLHSSISASQSHSSVLVRFPGGEFNAPAFDRNGGVYVSMDAFASGCSLRLYSDKKRGKMEIVTGNRRIKLTADNPFIPVIDHATNAIEKVAQLPLEVLRRDTALYAPAAAISPILAAAWDKGVAFSETPPTLDISGEARNARPATEIRSPEKPAATSPSAQSVAAEKKPPAAETASKADITHATVDVRRNGTVIRIHSRKQLPDPAREEAGDEMLILSFSGARIDESEFRQTPIAGDDVKSINGVQVGPDARLEIALGNGIRTRSILRDAEGNDLLVTLYKEAEIQEILSDEEQDKSSARKRKWALDCIVIDPGHGGRDPGAIGTSGLKEKNVTLGIALKLGEMIQKRLKGIKVVYTRRDDRFVELDRRGKLANEAKGKLFLSIHCNSTEKNPSTATGTEIYLLRPGRTEEAIRVAEFENSVVRLEQDYEKRYKKLTDENFIIVTMAQSAFMKYSERVADIFHETVKKNGKIRSLGVKQAGFYVLVGASMPGVLIESGFLSNPKEEAFLASQAGQTHVANLIFQTVDKFAEEYEKSLK